MVFVGSRSVIFDTDIDPDPSQRLIQIRNTGCNQCCGASPFLTEFGNQNRSPSEKMLRIDKKHAKIRIFNFYKFERLLNSEMPSRR